MFYNNLYSSCTIILKEAHLNELEQFENFSFVKGNLADKIVIESIFKQYKSEIVVNFGAQAGVRYSIGLCFFTVYGSAGRPDMAYFGFTNKLLKDETISPLFC